MHMHSSESRDQSLSPSIQTTHQNINIRVDGMPDGMNVEKHDGNWYLCNSHETKNILWGIEFDSYVHVAGLLKIL